ncbi:unnamed protein product, partial [Sphenostylis stenocarpa]
KSNEHVEEAYQLLDEMISRGVKLDTWSYNAIQAYHCDPCEYFEMMIDEGIPPYVTTVELLRNQLLGLGLLDHIEMLVDKMRQSTSYATQELANIMIGDQTTHNTLRHDQMDIKSD